MNNMNSGYNGYSMSNRAVEAYYNGEKPLSKWTKAEADALAEKVLAMSTQEEIVAALKAAAKE